MHRIIVLNAFIALSYFFLVKAELKVTQVQVLFRHGERTPRLEEIYPNDIYNISVYEPWGLAQLTNAGKRREYKIGQVLKTRYQELLGPLYVPKSIYAVSTDVDRTKDSLQLVLAGLFPPTEVQMWNSELPWIPIPIHFAPEKLDSLLVSHLCSQFTDTMDEIRRLPEVKERIAVHKDLYEFLTVKTGLNITRPQQVYQIYNLLMSQVAMNLTLPTWCTETILRGMSENVLLQYDMWSYTTKAKRQYGGPIVSQFIRNMHLDKVQENPRKVYLYSAHESTISAFMKAQGIAEPKFPLYGTAVIFEKLRDTDGKRFLKIVLWTGETEQLIELRLPGCEVVCPIEKYLELTKDVIPRDEERNCNWKNVNTETLRSAFEERTSYN